jgi:hypothetical protein
VVTDNHSIFYVYIDTVSPVREQFFKLAQTSIRNTIISPLESSSVYACLSNTSEFRYSRYTLPSHTLSKILINLFRLSLLHSIKTHSFTSSQAPVRLTPHSQVYSTPCSQVHLIACSRCTRLQADKLPDALDRMLLGVVDHGKLVMSYACARSAFYSRFALLLMAHTQTRELLITTYFRDCTHRK